MLPERPSPQPVGLGRSARPTFHRAQRSGGGPHRWPPPFAPARVPGGSWSGYGFSVSSRTKASFPTSLGSHTARATTRVVWPALRLSSLSRTSAR